MKKHFNLKSENIAGLIGPVGSFLASIPAGVYSVPALLVFLAGNGFLYFKGQTRSGYSAGAACLASGNFVLAASPLANSPSVFWALIAMGCAWTIGAARAPLAIAAEKLSNKPLLTTANALQPIAGVVNLGLRVPSFLAACVEGQFYLAAAIAVWGTADILSGRVVQTAAAIKRQF